MIVCGTRMLTIMIGWFGGALGVMVIVAGNGHGDTSSNPRRDWLHFHLALIPLRKVWILLFSLQLWVNSRADKVLKQLVYENENSEFKPLKLRLKYWPCVISCPSGGVGKYDNDRNLSLL